MKIPIAEIVTFTNLLYRIYHATIDNPNHFKM